MPKHTKQRLPFHRCLEDRRSPSQKKELTQSEIIAKENARIEATLKEYAWKE